ncbi:MAG: rhomboid family intramembrane serine protease [Minwuia sp.]|uniref:rhomboid family intramembrane serine protease n=1 Tax=Minwuia sp. TaxID=2493630 RepID=UPI003A84E2F8
MIPLHDDRSTHLTPWVVRGAVAVCVLVFLYELTLNARDVALFNYSFGVVPASLFGIAELPDEVAVIPAWATLATTIFVHGGFLHLIGNMLFLWTFGDNVEDSMGHGRFVIFFLVTGAVAAFTHAAWDMNSTVPLIGASGAVSGVLGAYILLYPRSRILVGIPLGPIFLPIRLRAWVMIGIWFGLQIFNVISSGVAGSGTAWLAHIAGFIAGGVLILFMRDKRHKLFSDETAMALSPATEPSALRIMRPDPHPDAPNGSGPWKKGPWG